MWAGLLLGLLLAAALLLRPTRRGGGPVPHVLAPTVAWGLLRRAWAGENAAFALQAVARGLPRTFATSCGAQRFVFSCDERVLGEVLGADGKQWRKLPDPTSTLDRLAGQGLSLQGECSPGWMAQRRALAPCFGAAQVRARWLPHVQALTDRLVAHWRSLPLPAAVDVQRELKRLTFDAMGLVALGADFGSLPGGTGAGWDYPAGGTVFDDFALVVEQSNSPARRALPAWLHDAVFRGRAREMEAALARLRQATLAAVRASAGDTLVSAAGGLSEEERVHNAFTFLLAGHETSANLLGFCLRELAADAELQRRCARDAELLEAALRETLRLYPPAPVISRRCAAPVEWAQPGDIAVLSILGLHRDPGVWEAPDEFRPARFLGQPRPKGWLPFSSGRRSCVGEEFAMAETVAVLQALLQAFCFSLAGAAPVVDRFVTLRFRGGLSMLVSRRVGGGGQ